MDFPYLFPGFDLTFTFRIFLELSRFHKHTTWMIRVTLHCVYKKLAHKNKRFQVYFTENNEMITIKTSAVTYDVL